jgi:hypothetical protein
MLMFAIGSDDQNHDNENHPGRVDTTQLREMLHHCPCLEVIVFHSLVHKLFTDDESALFRQELSLSIFDQSNLEMSDNPYTDVSSIFSTVTWPNLSTLKLQDIIANKEVMTAFLSRHPNIRILTAHLSINGGDLSCLPFSVDASLSEGALPYLEELDVPPALVRQILRITKRPSQIRKLHRVEPCDWAATVNAGPPIVATSKSEVVVDNTPTNLLEGLPYLRSLSVLGLQEPSQLDKLAAVAPDLDTLIISANNRSLYSSVRAPKHIFEPW